MKIPTSPFSEEAEDFSLQHFYVIVGVICLFLLLILRLWYLQIVRGYEFRIKSETNRTRVQDIAPSRGLIYDRNGLTLVDNYPSYELAIIREDVSDAGDLIHRLAYYLGIPYETLQARYNEIKKKPAFLPVTLVSNMTREELVAIETNRFGLPGVVIRVQPRRRYLHDQMAAHVIGYMGEVSQNQLDNPEYKEHRMGDQAGQYGIEREWETYLHGKRGHREVEVNAAGRVLQLIREASPTPGDNLYLTLDARLQLVAQEALGDQVGAIVALDPNSGEVLAMASNPTFSQNDFVNGITPEKWKALIENPMHPLENRAVGGQYPPGSTFKIVTAAAALEEKKTTPEDSIKCTGAYPYGDRTFRCWNRYGHGKVALHDAIKESCDVYFYDVGRQIGIERLSLYAKAFGLGRKTGIGLASERPGLVPNKEWKKKNLKKRWQGGETLHVSIGQGYLLTTPLQMAQVTAAAANGGTIYRPHLVQKITTADGNVKKYFEPEVVSRLNFKPETFELIRQGLAAVVNEDGGTGFRARLEDVLVAGKTGTSQVVTQKRQGVSPKDVPYKYRDHAWFVAFAPVDKPKIALAVVVEHVGHGGAVAAPVAKVVLQAFFHPDAEPLKSDIIDFEMQIEPGD